MEKIQFKIWINQFGNAKFEWTIPIKLINDVDEVAIEVPKFKYDLPKIGKIPVPFSSTPIKIEITKIEIKFNSTIIKNYLCQEDFIGNNRIIINKSEFSNGEEQDCLFISYEINSIVNNDTIFFVFVYPMINPIKKQTLFDIKVEARFSFNLHKYNFFEWYFNKNTGKRIYKNKQFLTKMTGDFIELNAKDLELNEFTELDIHLTATRLPFMIRRDIFWISVFIIFVLIVLSPLCKI